VEFKNILEPKISGLGLGLNSAKLPFSNNKLCG
jgi:hypothetical protein